MIITGTPENLLVHLTCEGTGEGVACDPVGGRSPKSTCGHLAPDQQIESPGVSKSPYPQFWVEQPQGTDPLGS